MNWGKFSIYVFAIYAIYFTIQLAFDFFKSKNKKQVSDGYENYDVSNLLDDSEQPTSVSSDFVTETTSPVERTNEESIPVVAAKKKVEVESIGTVEAQGVPIDEFLKQAQAESNNIKFQ